MWAAASRRELARVARLRPARGGRRLVDLAVATAAPRTVGAKPDRHGRVVGGRGVSAGGVVFVQPLGVVGRASNVLGFGQTRSSSSFERSLRASNKTSAKLFTQFGVFRLVLVVRTKTERVRLTTPSATNSTTHNVGTIQNVINKLRVNVRPTDFVEFADIEDFLQDRVVAFSKQVVELFLARGFFTSVAIRRDFEAACF